jgi:chorismate mutase
MPNRTDLDGVIGYLRQELDQIDQAIRALERIALAKRVGARGRARPNFRVHVNKRWTKHRVRQG